MFKQFLKIINQNIIVHSADASVFNLREVKHSLMNCQKIINTGFVIPTPYEDMKD